MRKIFGLLFMTAGALLIAVSIYFSYCIGQEERLVEQTSRSVLAEMARQLDQLSDDPGYVVDPYSQEMTTLMVDGYEYIGCLSVPALGLELPVMSQLDEYRLKLAPCLYMGTANEDNMIIGAHNYKKHFASLSKLMPGDDVVFTAMDGNIYFYQVASLETLMPEEREKLTDTDYALTLFTCTYGGRKRTVVRCDRA